MTRRLNQCAGDACGVIVDGRRWFCAGCFGRLPVDIRADLAETPLHRVPLIPAKARQWLVEHRPATIADRQIGAG